MAATKSPDIVISWNTASTPLGMVVRGKRYPSTHPAVERWPEFFVADGTAEEDWPTIAGAVGDRLERELAEEAEAARTRFLEAARGNPVHLQAKVLRSHRDFVGYVNGDPALVKKGSTALVTDELVLSYPEGDWR